MKITIINTRNSESMVMPLGILYVAAVMRQAGHQVQVFDPFFGDKKFIRQVVKFKPDLIGLSILTATYDTARKLVVTFRRQLPKTLICAGGVHPTILPQQTLKELNLDFVVYGEGEYTLREACQRLANGRTLANVKGVVYKNDGRIITNSPRELIANLDELPFPARDLLEAENYLIPPGYIRSYLLARTLTMYTSRGCPGNCTFCSSHLLFGRFTRRRSVGNVLEELKLIKDKYRLDGVYFMDDTFNVDQKWVGEFCRQKRQQKINIIWGCQTRVNTVNSRILNKMRQAGCVQVDFGVESGSDKVLAAYKKGQTAKMIKKAFRLAKKAKLRTFATLMIGSPVEKNADIKKSEKLLKEIAPDYTHISFCTPLPGTELYQQAVKMGWVPKDFGNQWDFIQTDSPIMAVNFSQKQLVSIRSRIYNHLFLNNLSYIFYPQNLPFFWSVFWAAMLQPKSLLKAWRQFLMSKNIEDLIRAALYLYHQRQIS